MAEGGDDAQNVRHVPMATLGNIEPFDDNLEDITSYVERLDQFFLANLITEERKAPVFLSLSGRKIYQLLKNLTAPQLPREKTYKELTDALEKHFRPKVNITTERYRFQSRKQGSGEPIHDYVAALKNLSINCAFNDLDDRLRDAFIFGLGATETKKRLLAKPELNFATAVQQASAIEQANADASEINRDVKPVHAVDRQRPRQRRRRQRPPPQPENSTKACYRCGKTNHSSQDCFYKDKTCTNCGKVGHIRPACRQLKNKEPERKMEKSHRRRPVHQLDQHSSEGEILSLNVHAIEKSDSDKIMINCKINKASIEMEVDTGSAVTLINRDLFERHFSDAKLQPTTTVLKSFTGDLVKPDGVLHVRVKHSGQQRSGMRLFVVDGRTPALFGRDWLRSLPLNWSEIKELQKAKWVESAEASKLMANVTHAAVRRMIHQHSAIFEPGIGKLQAPPATFHLKQHTPKFIKARTVPFSQRDKVKTELNRLQAEGIISPVKFSDYATPIVPIDKSNGRVRICGDFKCTLNQIIEPEQYPLPVIDEIFAMFGGGQNFSKIDLTEAYLAYEIHPDYRKYLTISTPHGLYEFNRLVYGISDAPAKWQKIMDQVLENIPYTKCIIDDILVSGENEEAHLKNLATVFARLEQFGLKVNTKKCEFFKPSIEFCGHKISNQGLHKSPSKVEAVLNAPPPKSVKELQSFIGMLTYYHKFLPNIAAELKPLYDLTKKDVKFEWKEKHKKAFEKAKQEIASERVLTHYRPSIPLVLQCDASGNGLGAVLSHKFGDRTERPIIFISRSLTAAEKNYSQLDLEATAIFWATKKLLHYLYGRHFYLVTDNKPLSKIFQADKSVPQISAMRLQRYALFLSGLNYEILHRPAAENANADLLSRLPLPTQRTALDEIDQLQVKMLHTLPIDNTHIKRYTQKDTVLARVYSYTQTGEWGEREGEFAPYYRRRHELSTQLGVLMWGARVVIPPPLRKDVLEELHSTHMGIVKTKALARSYFYFPGIDGAIEKMVKSCPKCVHHIKTPPEVQLQSWNVTETPWERIHIDHAGPFQGNMFLIVIDSKTKWLEVEVVRSTDTSTTIRKLQTMFARLGVPKVLVSDNATGFTSADFGSFLGRLGIKHARSTPYHPKTNGLAEKAVQFLKNSLSAMTSDALSLQTKLDRILLKYRVTPHVTTGEAPGTLMFNRRVRTKLDAVRPNLDDKLRQQQESSKKNDLLLREFNVGDRVIVKDFRQNKEKWEPCTVEARTTPTSYRVRTADGATWRRHADQMRNTLINPADARSTQQPDEECETAAFDTAAPAAAANHQPQCEDQPEAVEQPPKVEQLPPAKQLPPIMNDRPQRARKVPSKYRDFIMN